MVTLGGYGWFVWLPHTVGVYVDQSEVLLNKTLESVAEGLVPLMLEDRLSNIYDNLDIVMQKNPDWLYLGLQNADGQSLYPFDSDSLPPEATYTKTIDHSIAVGDQVLGTLTLVYDFSRIARDIKNSTLVFLGLITGTLILFSVIMIGVIHVLILAPATRLSKAAKKMAEGDYQVKLPSAGQDEVGVLISSFANMRNKINQGTVDLKVALSRAEIASTAKTQFLANMSHELRTPMNGIIGLSSLLLDAEMSEDDRESVRSIHLSAEGLLALLNDLLDFSKIEAGELTLEYIPIAIQDCIKQVFDVMRPIAVRKGLDLRLSYSPTAPHRVVSDPNRIRQILYNLIGNALKFTTEGYVQLSISSFETPDGGDGLELRVEDTGIGVPDQIKDKIFEKFTQADISTARKFGGTGLGLAITKQLVQMMNGKIGVDSIEGRGSTFWFKIPVEVLEDDQDTDDHTQNIIEINQSTNTAQETTQTSPVSNHAATNEQSSVHTQFSNHKALVVDDHPVNILFAQKLMVKLGFSVVDTAHDGRIGVDMFQNGNYDIILMDCQMPDMDGFEATKAIREIEHARGTEKPVPIVALTADAIKGAREKCLEAGMDHYMTKPINRDVIVDALEMFLCDPKTVTQKQVQDNQPVEIEASEPLAKPSDDPVELEHVRMFVDGGPEEEKEFFELFINHSEQDIQNLATHLDNRDQENWRKAAHKIKGSAANLGAHQLSHICKTAEESFESSDEEKTSLLNRIRAEHDIVQNFLRSLHA